MGYLELDLREFFKKAGYETQISIAKKILKEDSGYSKNLGTMKATLSSIMSGRRKPSKNLIQVFGKISIDTEKFLEILDKYPKKQPPSLLEKELDDVYYSFKQNFSEEDLHPQKGMLLKFRKFTKKYIKEE